MRYVLVSVASRGRPVFSWYVYRIAFYFSGIYFEGKRLMKKTARSAGLVNDCVNETVEKRSWGPSFDIGTYIFIRDKP